LERFMIEDAAETDSPEITLSHGLRCRFDQPHPRVERAEEALRQLRRRIETHLDQEERLSRIFQGWEACWSAQCDELRRQVARLESHLAAWMPKEAAPELSLVDGE
jgi:hypothetical protein